MPGNQDSFFAAVLAALGAPVTPENMRFMRAWNQAEGMDPANFNPFATTQGAPGARDLNSVGVKAYPTFDVGVAATVQTLLNGMYGGIIDALRSGTSAVAAAQGVANSPWGTGSLVLQILGGGGPTPPTGPDSRTLPGGVGGAPAAGGVTATNAGILSLNPIDIFNKTTGAIVQPILKGALRIVFLGVGVAGGVVLIALGVQRVVSPVTKPITESLEPAAKAAAVAI